MRRLIDIYLDHSFVFVPIKLQFDEKEKKPIFLAPWTVLVTITPEIFRKYVFPLLDFTAATHVAIITKPSNLRVLDFDNIKQMPQDFVQNVLNYAKQQKIPTLRTRKGFHLYFRNSEAANRLSEMIVVAGGYIDTSKEVVFAPLQEDDEYYHWIISLEGGNLRELTDDDLRVIVYEAT